MDQRLKEIVENFDKMKIGLDDTFSFSCNQCGKCCINREDILMTPLDLFKAAKKLDMSIVDFIKDYCESYIGESSRMVIVRLKPRGSIKRCPLLKNRQCSIHESKPVVCAMFPIGRAISIPADKYDIESIGKADIQYIFNGVHCEGNEVHTVREWLDHFGIPINDEFFIEWQKTISELHRIIAIAEKRFSSESTMEALWSIIYITLYQHYDMTKEFFPQFIENRDELIKTLKLAPGLNLGGKKDGK